MKKKVLVIAATLLVLSLLCACSAQPQQVRLSYIGADEAKARALSDAGLNAANVSFSAADMKTRNGLDYYELQFSTAEASYSYDVDALSGNIIARSSTLQNESAASAALQPASAQAAAPAANAGGEIGAEEAKAIALKHAGLTEADVQFVRTERDFDDGRAVYEIEFYDKDHMEYDYDVSVQNGEILKFDRDAEHYSGAAPATASGASAGGEIGAEEAKAIALSHAGRKESEVVFVRADLDYDDGRKVYEVEFFEKDGMEYDYDIDAASGEILSYDRDAEYYRPTQQSADQPASSAGSGSQSGSAQAAISESEAKRIALAQVPGADESHIRKFKVDRDDGRLEYDGEIVYNNMEYEFEIDAYSGAIRDWDAESVYD